MDVDYSRARCRSFVESGIVRPRDIPVIGALIQGIQIEAGSAIGTRKRGDNRVQVGLTGGAAHGSDGCVGSVHAGFRSFENGGRVDATGVMSVKMNWQSDFLFQRTDQLPRSVRFA